MFWIFAAVALYLLVTVPTFRSWVFKAGFVLAFGIGAPIAFRIYTGAEMIEPWWFLVSFGVASLISKHREIKRVWTDPNYNPY